MKDLAKILNGMCAEGVIKSYALFGAMAQMRYTEPVATIDADVLVTVSRPEKLDVLKPIYEYCAARGFHSEGETIAIGPWPVQFIPVFNTLTEEALENADTADFDGEPLRVVQAAYLAVIALSVGRAKDFTRILALLESGSVQRQEIQALSAKHGLSDSWKGFEKRFLS